MFVFKRAKKQYYRQRSAIIETSIGAHTIGNKKFRTLFKSQKKNGGQAAPPQISLILQAHPIKTIIFTKQ